MDPSTTLAYGCPPFPRPLKRKRISTALPGAMPVNETVLGRGHTMKRPRVDEPFAWNSPRTNGDEPRFQDEFANGFVTIQKELQQIAETQHHIPDLEKFPEKLRRAYEPRWATRGRPYRTVSCLLLQWEDDDLGVMEEIAELSSILQDTYHFDVTTWQIPSTKQRYIELMKTVNSFLSADEEGHLFIIYYGGHAYQSHSHPVWVS